ncbi:MAG: M24 family metallopeptidase [Planctomycetota bacterium]|nr:M24 family metallopeptidase [Planctomycetota bacterium]
MSTINDSAIVMAGIPETNKSLYHRIRFLVGDPAALIELPKNTGGHTSTLILRDIEMARARQRARVDQVACPAAFTPADGLSGDRETATAQATAELLRRNEIRHVISDRTLPLIYAHEINRAGIAIDCDPEMGILQRRAKDSQEIEWLHQAQQATEGAMEMACRLVAAAKADGDGVLQHDGGTLTAERLRAEIDVWLLERGFSNPTSIVACGADCADCHNHGSGPLRTEQSVIIDIFPRDRRTFYNGDCTRTVVNGDISDELTQMLAAVVEAKAAAISATRTGVTGEAVHRATCAVVEHHGFKMGLPPDDAADTYTGMTHGTGHGIGLDVHEPPLLDFGGPELIVGDALTIEPGIYSRAYGGVRVEDLVIVTNEGCDNLNRLPEILDWRQ